MQILALLLSFFLVAGCKTTDVGTNDSTIKTAGSGGKKLVPPPAGTTDNDLDVDAVVNYMKAYRKRFYEDKNYLFVAPNVIAPGIEDMQNCLSNNPAYWSPLVQHFYCLHGSYQGIVPNMRGCFSTFAGKMHVNNRGWYPEIFDYCTYQDFDAVINADKTKFDLDELVKNKNANNKVGVMKYLTADEEEVFKYVLWTWYNPFAFKVADQQKVLDEFWGAGTFKADMSSKKNHHEFDSMVAFMKDVAANGGEVPWPGTKRPDGTVIPVPPPPPPLGPNEICSSFSDKGEFLAISAPETATVTVFYRLKAGAATWTAYNTVFDKVGSKWQVGWSRSTTDYDLKFDVDGVEFITDVFIAGKRPCP